MATQEGGVNLLCFVLYLLQTSTEVTSRKITKCTFNVNVSHTKVVHLQWIPKMVSSPTLDMFAGFDAFSTSFSALS